jgi:hypothetical protein
MNFFRKNRESTHVKKIRAVRAVYLNPELQEVDVTFVNEAGDRLTLQLTVSQTFGLITELSNAYEAIVPSLGRGGRYATWDGMHE